MYSHGYFTTITMFSWKWLLPTSYYRMDIHFSTRSIFMTITWHTGNENVPCNSSTWKGKDLKACFKLDGVYRRNWRAWREEILVQGHTPCFGGDLSLLKPSYVKHELCQISLYFCRRGASFRLFQRQITCPKKLLFEDLTWDKSVCKGKIIAKAGSQN